MKKALISILLIFTIFCTLTGCSFPTFWYGAGADVYPHFDKNKDGYCDGNSTTRTYCQNKDCTVLLIKYHLVQREDGTYCYCKTSVDARDYVCDNCGHKIPNHIDHCWDYDRDGYCDYCSHDVLTLPEGTHICMDLFMKDSICDECGKEMSIAPCLDADGNYRCDFCDKWMPKEE